MVPMTAAVVADRSANRIGNSVQVTQELVDGFCFEFRISGDGLVEVGDIGGVVFAMVDFHGSRVDVRFERVLGIR